MTFSLWQEPWLPVRREGQIDLVGLQALFSQAEQIEDLAISQPPAAEGVLRILLAITARIAGLDDVYEHEWAEARLDLLEAGRFDPAQIARYTEEFEDRLDLFHPSRPFLQNPDLVHQCSKSSGINKLLATRPSGNNHAWFGGHHFDAEPALVTPAEAALGLIVQTFYGPSGRCSARKVGSIEEANTMAGPLRRTISYHPVGANLFETLLVGLAEPSNWQTSTPDLCPWELDELPDVPPAVSGYRSMLTGRGQHALLLVSDDSHEKVIDSYLTWAWRAKLPPVADPYLVTQISKEGSPYPRQANSSRALFRDLDALLMHTRTGERFQRPLIFDDCANYLSPAFSRRIRVRAHGFEQDGQTRDKQWYSAITPPVLGFLEENNPSAAIGSKVLREAAEMAGERLEYALKKAWQAYTSPAGIPLKKAPEGPWPTRAAAAYWSTAEREFWRLLGAEEFEGAMRHFGTLALDIYDEVTAVSRAEGRGARACESARGLIANMKYKEAA